MFATVCTCVCLHMFASFFFYFICMSAIITNISMIPRTFFTSVVCVLLLQAKLPYLSVCAVTCYLCMCVRSAGVMYLKYKTYCTLSCFRGVFISFLIYVRSLEGSCKHSRSHRHARAHTHKHIHTRSLCLYISFCWLNELATSAHSIRRKLIQFFISKTRQDKQFPSTPCLSTHRLLSFKFRSIFFSECH